MADLSRRRFLTDLALIGGALALAAGLGAMESAPPPPAEPKSDAHHPQYTSVTSCCGRP